MALEVQAAVYVLGSVAFFFFWVLAVFPRFPALPIGRTSGALLGAALMVVFQIESTHQAYASVDLPILGLLFGTMVVTIYLERAGLFAHLGDLLSWGDPGAKGLMCRLCILISITSALFTNDTVCVAMTGFVLKLCREKSLPAEPFLVALATSANIGSAATPIGNPQNLIIAVQGRIPFGKFLRKLLPAVVVGVTINTVLLLVIYWKHLSPKALAIHRKSLAHEHTDDQDYINVDHNWGIKPCAEKTEPEPKLAPPMFDHEKNSSSELSSRTHIALPIEGEELSRTNKSENFSMEIMKQPSKSMDQSANNKAVNSSSLAHKGKGESVKDFSCEGAVQGSEKWAAAGKSSDSGTISGFTTKDIMTNSKARMKLFRKLSVFMVTIGMLAALLYGMDMSWSALTAAVVLMVLDFKDSGPGLDKVSYSLLVFFSGMFITVDGFNRTKIPGLLWSKFEPVARINRPSGIVMLSIVIIILSNIASNVPTVLLLGPQVAASTLALHGASPTKAWLILAWVSTLAGNLTLLGSAANLIVSEQAKRDESGANLSCTKHLRFGPLSTIIVTFVGLPLIHLTMLND